MHFSTNFIVGILHRLDELFLGDEDEVVRVILEFAEKKYKLKGLLTNVEHDDDGPTFMMKSKNFLVRMDLIQII